MNASQGSRTTKNTSFWDVKCLETFHWLFSCPPRNISQYVGQLWAISTRFAFAYPLEHLEHNTTDKKDLVSSPRFLLLEHFKIRQRSGKVLNSPTSENHDAAWHRSRTEVECFLQAPTVACNLRQHFSEMPALVIHSQRDALDEHFLLFNACSTTWDPLHLVLPQDTTSWERGAWSSFQL